MGAEVTPEVPETPEPPETPEVPEVPEAPAAEQPALKLALDELFGENAPAWLREVGGIEAPPVTMADIEALPPAGKAVIGQLRARGQAAERQALEAAEAQRQKEAELAARERMLARRAADQYKFVRDQQFREVLANADPGEAPADPYSPEAIQWAARKAAHEHMTTLIQALEGAEQRQSAAAQAAEQAAAEEARIAAEEAYVAEHYDSLSDPDVKAATKQLLARGVPLEEAHSFAAAKVAQARAAASDPVREARMLAKERLAAGRRAPTNAAALPKEPTADELVAYTEANPDATGRVLAELQRAASW